uniref:Autophagy-related protein 14 n=1 Tax=Meloidogyne incognita TaxID=6306 RepID=A0A914MNV0_MELIC
MLLNAIAINSANQKQLSPLGILQRFEIQQSSTNKDINNCSCSTSQQIEIISTELSSKIRCPYCRLSQKNLICVNCLSTHFLRIGKVKEELRRLQQCKNAICGLIMDALNCEVKFESEYHQVRRSIEDLKTKIAWKRDQVGRLRHRIAGMESHSERNQRNIVLLEKKMLAHSERINKTSLKIADIRLLSEHTRAKLNERLSLIAKVLIQIFRFEKRQLSTSANNPIPAWTGQSKMSRAAFLLNNCLCLDRISLLSKAASIQQSDEPTNNNVNSTQISPSQNSSHPIIIESLASLEFLSQFIHVLARFLDFHLPYKSLNKEFSLFGFGSGARINSSSTTLEQSLRQILFKLDYSLAHLCLSKGLPSEECELTEPFANLYTFLVKTVGMKLTINCAPQMDHRLLRQIMQQFAIVKPDGRINSEFTLDNVENDWVRVYYSSM